MMHKAIRALVILPCVALIMSVSALHAATVVSEKFNIPFAFQVRNQTLPPGEYRIHQAESDNFAVLINTRTGARVEVLRPANTHQEGKAKLVFSGAPELPSLAHIY